MYDSYISKYVSWNEGIVMQISPMMEKLVTNEILLVH